MVYIFKTVPFQMSFQEIRGMTFRQAGILLKEYEKDRNKRHQKFNATLKKFEKAAFPVIDLTKGIF